MTKQSTITEMDFNLISTAIQGLLSKTGLVKDHETSASLFAILGAVIIRNKLGVHCRPVAGEWYVNHPDGLSVLGIGSAIGDCAGAKQAGFHMWIQTETHIIDLMSPLYPEIFPAANSPFPFQRRMLQLPKNADAKSWDEFQRGAPLLTLPDVELTDATMEQVASDQRCEELAGVLLEWWPKLKLEAKSVVTLYQRGGEIRTISCAGYEAKGAWKTTGVIA